jgi:uncharacterized protein
VGAGVIQSDGYDPDDYDADGLYKPNATRLSTFSHRWVDPLELADDEVDLDDIAHSLSRICRYNGHTFGHLSVARHSLWVSKRAEFVTGSPSVALAGLLHDAAEAYIGDMVRPLKHREGAMRDYAEAEERCEAVIARVFGIPHPLPDAVREADNWVLTEMELPVRRWSWDSQPMADKHAFLARYYFLREKIG